MRRLLLNFSRRLAPPHPKLPRFGEGKGIAGFLPCGRSFVNPVATKFQKDCGPFALYFEERDGRWTLAQLKTLVWILLAAGLTQSALAQDEMDFPALPPARYRNGQQVLNAFAPISARTRNSVVEVNVNEDTVALGAVVDASGLVLTKASEIASGKLTCWLADGKEVEAKLLASDEDDDVALVRVKAEGLKPIQWATNSVVEGQWAITPGLAETPQAVGIISTLTHKIQPQRALIGVQWAMFTSRPTVDFALPGFGAEEAGVKAGDVIVAVDGTEVSTKDQVVEILKTFREGQSVQIRFKREEKEYSTSIKLMLLKFSSDVSLRNGGFEQAIEHDTVLEPWQCGGPLVNLDGHAIGLNIARASRVATYALPASLAQQILARLKVKAEHLPNDDR
jgi:serine protease Do